MRASPRARTSASAGRSRRHRSTGRDLAFAARRDHGRPQLVESCEQQFDEPVDVGLDRVDARLLDDRACLRARRRCSAPAAFRSRSGARPRRASSRRCPSGRCPRPRTSPSASGSRRSWRSRRTNMNARPADASRYFTVPAVSRSTPSARDVEWDRARGLVAVREAERAPLAGEARDLRDVEAVAACDTRSRCSRRAPSARRSPPRSARAGSGRRAPGARARPPRRAAPARARSARPSGTRTRRSRSDCGRRSRGSALTSALTACETEVVTAISAGCGVHEPRERRPRRLGPLDPVLPLRAVLVPASEVLVVGLADVDRERALRAGVRVGRVLEDREARADGLTDGAGASGQGRPFAAPRAGSAPTPSPRARSCRSRGRTRGRRSRARRLRSARRPGGRPLRRAPGSMISKLRSTRIGASPIDGSSMSRSFGRAISALPHRDHLLLAARERPRELLPALREQREELVDAVEVLPEIGARAQVRAHLEVLEHGHGPEQPAVLGDDREPALDAARGRHAGDVLASETSAAPSAAGTIPRIVFSVVDFPEALPPSRHTSSPSPTSRSTSWRMCICP